MENLRKGVTRNKRDTGYRSRLHRDRMHVKVFTDVKYGGRDQARQAANDHQANLERKHPPRVFHVRPHRSKKSKLPVGVYHDRARHRYKASWTDPITKKRHLPTFSYEPGDKADQARKERAAIRLRKSKEQEIAARKKKGMTQNDSER